MKNVLYPLAGRKLAPVHITICAEPDGTVLFYPEGDPERVADALALIVRLFHEHPERIRCAVGACDERHGHG